MALERRNGYIFYYRYVRRHGRVKREYVASGEWAELLAQDDWEQRQEREQERQAIREIEDEHRDAYQTERQRGQGIKTLVTIGLEGLGFIRYQRGRWKRRSMRALTSNGTKAGKKPVVEKIRQLVNAIVRGDQSAVPKLQAISRSAPRAFAREVEGAFPALAYYLLAKGEMPTDHKLRDDFVARMHLVAHELAGDDPSTARRLCSEAAAFAWGECWLLNMKAGAAKVDRQSVESSRRQTAAARRLMMSLKTVAQIAAAESKPRRRAVQGTVEEEDTPLC